MAYLSIKDVSQQYNQKIRTVRGALQRGYLKGHKDINSQWQIRPEDAEYYFTPPCPNCWISFTVASLYFSIKKEKLYKLRDEGAFAICIYKKTIYAKIKDLLPTLVALGYLRSAEITYRAPSPFHHHRPHQQQQPQLLNCNCTF